MKLIREFSEDITVLKESDDHGNMFIEGIIMQADIQNRNKRLYPSSILFKEVKRYNKEFVEKNIAYGELDHPETPIVKLSNSSHRFTELTEDGSNIIGKAIILNTTNGKTAKGIMECGGTLGISSRGVGSLKRNTQGINEVQGDFRLSTAGDLVANPSAPNAFVNGIMENVDWFFDSATNQWSQQIIDETKQIGNESVKKLEEMAEQLFANFVKSLKI